MMGPKKKPASKLFYYGFNLEERVPEDHVLRRIVEVVDFGFVRRRVADSYGYNGHESEDPIVIVKLMFLLFFEDIKSERELVRVLPMRLDWLWFLGLDLDSKIPHHSVLSKARRRWGVEVFAELFTQVVRLCVEAGLVAGEKLHVDGSLVDADASRDSMTEAVLRKVWVEQEQKLARLEVGKRKLISRTDPDAVVVKRGRADVSRPRYKHHRAVDDLQGVVTAVKSTPADRNEPDEAEALIDSHEQTTRSQVKTLVGDHQYGTNAVYRMCQQRGIRAHVGDVKTKLALPKLRGIFELEDFQYDPEQDRYRCPAGHYLKRNRGSGEERRGYADYRIALGLCRECELKPRCTRSKAARRLRVPLQLEAIQKGREQSHSRPARRDRRRRRYLLEGSFGDATHRHHFKRSRWRGLEKQPIQDYLIATCQNLRILLSRGWYLKTQDQALRRLHKDDLKVAQRFAGSTIRWIWSTLKAWLSRALLAISVRSEDDLPAKGAL